MSDADTPRYRDLQRIRSEENAIRDAALSLLNTKNIPVCSTKPSQLKLAVLALINAKIQVNNIRRMFGVSFDHAMNLTHDIEEAILRVSQVYANNNNKWLEFPKNKPQPGDLCIVTIRKAAHDPFDTFTTCLMFMGGDEWDRGELNLDQYGFGVTHYMPLPEPAE